MMQQWTSEELASAIDHTLLKADATKDQIKLLCDEAIQYKFATVCVQPCWVSLAAELLKDQADVGVTTVIGFPLGAASSGVKAYETNEAIAAGATEIDMVMNIGYLKSGLLEQVREDIVAVVQAANNRAIVKVILETDLLTEVEIAEACRLAVTAGANYVKTSTGFSKGGATKEHITLMRATVGPHIGVKASGGVRDYSTAIQMLEAGATRIGASAGIDIIEKKSSSNLSY